MIFYQEKKKESEFTVPTKPVRGKTTNQPAEKSESFKIYSDNSLKSEPTSSSLLEDTKMLLQVPMFFQDSIKKKCIFSHFMEMYFQPFYEVNWKICSKFKVFVFWSQLSNHKHFISKQEIKWQKISGSGSIYPSLPLSY